MVFTCAGTRKTCPWTRLTYLRLWTLTKVCFSHRTLDFMFALRFPQQKSDLKMIIMILCVKRDLANLSERSSVPQVKYRLLELFPPSTKHCS